MTVYLIAWIIAMVLAFDQSLFESFPLHLTIVFIVGTLLGTLIGEGILIQERM